MASLLTPSPRDLVIGRTDDRRPVYIQRAWLDFLLGLYRRAGGADGMDLDSLQAMAEENEADLDRMATQVAGVRALAMRQPVVEVPTQVWMAILGRLSSLERRVKYIEELPL